MAKWEIVLTLGRIDLCHSILGKLAQTSLLASDETFLELQGIVHATFLLCRGFLETFLDLGVFFGFRTHATELKHSEPPQVSEQE